MINFGALQQGGGFQNALATGLQLGAMARQRQDEREFRNALTQFDPNNPETLKPIMAARPDVGMQLQGQMQQQQRAAQEAELTEQALSNDPKVRDQALQQLAKINFPKFKSLNEMQQEAVTAETTLFGNAALDLSQIPYEQRRDMFITYAQKMPQFAEQINEIAFLPQAEQERVLQVAIVNAGLLQEMLKLNAPQTLNVQPGAGVYERDPRTGAISTIIQPNYGQAPSFSPVPQGGGGSSGGFSEGQTATNPATGQKIVFRNGAWRPM
jgi:hypothetical protein